MNHKKFSKKDIVLFCLALLVFISLMGVVFFQREWVDEMLFGTVPVEYAEVEDMEMEMEEDLVYSLSPDYKEVEGDSFEVNVVLDEYEEEFRGVNLLMSFDGPAEYESVRVGDIDSCVPEEITGDELERDADLILYCLVPPGGDEVIVSSGDVFATLEFKVLNSGDFSISFKDDADSQEYLYDGDDGQYMLSN